MAIAQPVDRCEEHCTALMAQCTQKAPIVVTQALDWLEAQIREGPVFGSPTAVTDYLRLRIANLDHEVFTVLFLDAQNRLIDTSALFRGTLTQTSVYPREIAREALARNAAAVILAHNHPSDHAEPSAADCALTQSVRNALGLLDIRVLDHFVVTRSHCVSFAERGLLN